MTNRATLESLLARVLEGEGPDLELDAEITRMLLPPDADAVTRSRHGWSYRVFGPDGWDDEWLENKPYTASLDAALTLVPEGLSWHAAMRKCLPPIRATGSVWVDNGQQYALFTADAATPPRALIAACLKARMEAQPLSNP